MSLAKAKLATPDGVVLVLDTRDHIARDLAQAIIERAGDLDLDTEEARILRKPDVVPRRWL